MTATNTPSHGKRADIQGMRAIAVLGVLAFHASHVVLPGGFVGVDVFFVLSGYLITQVLLRPMEEKRFSIRDFYRRRIRRLYPALFTVLAFTMVMGLAFFPPTLLKELVKSQFFTTLFLSNFAFARETGYFDLQAELKPLLHTWSLGVEEQFYLLFPPILYVLHRRAKRFMWPALGLLALWSLWFSQTRLAGHPEVSFFFPTTRAFGQLIGARCVGLFRSRRSGWRGCRKFSAWPVWPRWRSALLSSPRNHPSPACWPCCPAWVPPHS